MHFDTNRRYYNADELLDEVQDLRDRARVIRKKRTKVDSKITFCRRIHSRSALLIDRFHYSIVLRIIFRLEDLTLVSHSVMMEE